MSEREELYYRQSEAATMAAEARTQRVAERPLDLADRWAALVGEITAERDAERTRRVIAEVRVAEMENTMYWALAALAAQKGENPQ